MSRDTPPTVVGGLDLATLSASQRRVVTDLLEVTDPRPAPDPDRPRRLRDLIEGQLAPVLEQRAVDAPRIRLGKTQLDALACDGRYLDQQRTPFSWSRPIVRGQLVHSAIALDHHVGRGESTAELLAHAWEEFRHSGDGHLAYAETLTDLEVTSLQADASTAVEEYRATFPRLPQTWRVVWEPTIVARFGAGAVTVRGKPDLVLGRVSPDQRRMLLIDLKTGNRSRTDRQDMRWYALLATLKYRTAPFKVGTFYIDEGRWDDEVVTDDVLEAAARGMVGRLITAIRLTDDPVARQLHAGPMCRWCGLAESCEEKQRADAEYAATTAQPG
ncbi:PD-(D/E)XK nuclease family protein [Euzebya tangerina]|uniref:PD-(D/E)XK nuclease family protein n=1 Tax=Euzebya tangerina TaxID=591198 RepID=UPI000E30FC69|nr:PD-(D/E)XK nuclease family protein [Euzebya tangerina]